MSLSGALSRRTPTHTVATRLQRFDAARERDQGTDSARLRGAVNARETLAQLYRTGALGTRRYRSNRAPGEEGTIGMPFRGEIARLTEDATIAFSLQVRFAISHRQK